MAWLSPCLVRRLVLAFPGAGRAGRFAGRELGKQGTGRGCACAFGAAFGAARFCQLALKPTSPTSNRSLVPADKYMDAVEDLERDKQQLFRSLAFKKRPSLQAKAKEYWLECWRKLPGAAAQPSKQPGEEPDEPDDGPSWRWRAWLHVRPGAAAGIGGPAGVPRRGSTAGRMGDRPLHG